MVDYRVRFVGDLGNLAQFNSTIRSALSSNNSVLQGANSGVVSRALGGIPIRPPNMGRPGFSLRNATTQLDQYNNALIQSGTVVRQFTTGYKTDVGSLGGVRATPIFGEAYHTDFRKAVANLSTYAQVVGQLAPVDAKINSLQRAGAVNIAKIENAKIQLARLVAAVGPEQALIAGGREAGGKGIGAYTRLERLLGPNPAKLTSYLGLTNNMETDAEYKGRIGAIIQGLDKQKVVIQNELRKNIKEIQNDPVVRAFAQNAYYSATNPEGYVGANGAYALSNKNVRQDLIKKTGLGGGAQFGTQTFLQNAEASGFQVDKVYQDLEKNVTRVTGSVKNAQGIMTQFSYAIDKNGKVVERWGGSLSGARGFLNQTGRDLVKVIEWTIATTVVFGALGVAVSSLGSINELNSNLQRFAITAQLTTSETDKMFKSLAQVAYQTATPLNELIQAADDMALATRRANQSTDEWHVSILELANAVGILTNISGLDTVRATDLLVASMKQLDLTTTDLVPLLNQITAAAGGQANSITDIATALGSLSQAATEAGVSTTHQIAAIQVISLATNKSADETANAFKNLFGAINADISVKKLKEFGIQVRDAEGNLRPFLDIYKDISDAIDKGIIPQGRVTEVLRAISGGRTGRQADAAALIANINKVFEVQKVAVNASNEALIANARILDTNKAKIIQVQNAFSASVYDKFNKTLQDLIGTLAQFGTILATTFGAVPQPIIALVTELGALLVAFKLLGRLGSTLGIANLFNGITKSFQGTTVAAEQASIAVTRLSASQTSAERLVKFYSASPLALTNLAATRPPLSTLGPNPQNVPTGLSARMGAGLIPPIYSSGYAGPSRSSLSATEESLSKSISRIPSNIADSFRQSKLGVSLFGFPTFGRSKEGIQAILGMEPETKGIISKLTEKLGGRTTLVGAAVGGLLGAATSSGQSTLAAASSAAQFAGISALLVPGGQLVGGALIAGSIALQHFAEEEENAKKKSVDLQQALYNLTEQWKIDQAGTDAARTSYNEIQNSLRGAKAGTAEYAELQGNLGKATVDLGIALRTQQTDLNNILDVLQQLDALSNKGGPKWGQFINSIKSGGLIGLDKNTLDQLVGQLSQTILSASGQPVFATNIHTFNPNALNPSTNNTFLGRSAVDILNNPQFLKQYLGEYLPGITFGIGNSKDTSQLFKGYGETAGLSNPAVVAAIRSQLSSLKDELGADKYAYAVNQFDAAVAAFGSASSVVANVLGEVNSQVKARELLGILYGEQDQNVRGRLAFAQGLQATLENRAAPTVVPGRDTGAGNVAQNIYDQATKNLADTIQKLVLSNGDINKAPLNRGELTNIANLGLQNTLVAPGLTAFDATKSSITELQTAQGEYLKLLGATDEQIKTVVTDSTAWANVMNEALQDMNKAVDDFTNTGLQNVGQKLLELQARLQGGEFEGGTGNKQYQFLLNQNNQLLTSYKAVSDASKAFNQVLRDNAGDGVQVMLDALNKLHINGFQGIPATLDAINGAFFSWISTLNLSDKQIQKVVANWVKLMGIAAQAAVLLKTAAAGGFDAHIVPNNQGGSTVIKTDINKIIAGLLSQIANLGAGISSVGAGGIGTNTGGSTGSKTNVGTLYLSDEQRKLFSDPTAMVKQAYQDALKLQAQIPGQRAKDKNDIVAVFNGLNKIFQERGVSEELMRQALDNLTNQLKSMSDKADTVRRIRIGSGDFSAIANVPINAASGASVGDTNNITVTLNLAGSLTPAQMSQFADMVAASIARRL